jgi:2,4-dienoyl-CoA reductase-like NADH-dependent reductase (Old Yellow Enzyme family)
MAVLFESVPIGRLTVPNRFVRSATYDGAADAAGHVTPEQIRLFEDLAAGGAGLIVTGLTYVNRLGRMSPVQNSIADDACMEGFRKLTGAVHAHGAKIAVQLVHAGREAAGALQQTGEEAIGPSVVTDDPNFKRPYRAASGAEIEEIVEDFAEAAERARRAGFDAVQLHGAHAYLLSQFLSPYTNRRTDQWGGPLQNRLRLHHAVITSIRQKVGPDYPLLIKIGAADGFAGGLGFDEGREAARMASEWGCDALEISQGLRGRPYTETEFRTGIDSPDKEAYFRIWCREIKAAVEVPVMMVGGLRSPSVMEATIENREADFVSLCRPLIKEPGLVNEWRSGSRRQSSCISCNMCLEALRKGKTLHCAYEKSGQKAPEGQGNGM